MADNKTAHKWYRVTYTPAPGAPSMEEAVQASSPQKAAETIRYNNGPTVEIQFVWESMDFSAETNQDEWVRNVQYIRVEFPPLEDKKQEEETESLAKHIQDYMDKRFIGYIYGPLDGSFTVCTDGFMRADHNFDNIELKGSCSNYPTRGTGDNEP